MQTKETLAGLFILAVAGLSLWLWLTPSGLKWAPEVTFTTLQGERLAMDDLRGRPLLVTFWATTCPGCLKEMPHLVELYEEFGHSRFQLIGVAMSYDPPNRVLELASERQLPYPVSLDLDGALAAAFGDVMLTPTSFLIDPEGRIVRHSIGAMDMSELRQDLENLLYRQVAGDEHRPEVGAKEPA